MLQRLMRGTIRACAGLQMRSWAPSSTRSITVEQQAASISPIIRINSPSGWRAMKQSGQRSIASFFTKPAAASKPSAPATDTASLTKTQLADQTNQLQHAQQEQQCQPSAKHKRLKRTIEDSPDSKAAQVAAAGLEDDDVDMAAPQNKAQDASPRRDTPVKASPRRRTTAGSASPKADEGAAGAVVGAAEASPAPADIVPPAVPATGTKRKSAAAVKPAKTTAKPAAAAAAAADTDAVERSEDSISFTASSSGSGASGDEGGEVQSGVKRLKKRDDTSKPKRGKSAGKATGVGSVALQEAQRALQADIPALCKWKAGEPVPYAFLADTFEAISENTKRLEMTSILTNCFRAIQATSPEDLLPAVNMCVNQVAASHKGIELGVGDSILLRALAESTGRTEAALKKELQTEGDIGTLAVKAKSTQRTMFATKPLTVRGVFQAFKDIAASSGANSQERKRSMIVKLMASSKGNEAGYVMRSLQGKLRIGLADQSVLLALAHAVLLHKEDVGKDAVKLAQQMDEAAQVVKAAYSECPSYDELVPALLQHPIWEVLDHCHFMPSVPVKPMLAKPTTGVGEVLEKFAGKEFTCEYKYDGERAQIHIMDGGKKVMIFSRNSEDMTSKYPDIAARIPGLLQSGITSAVIDAEAVGWDPQHKKILPFQILSTRARKDVTIKDIKVQVVVFAFDCLYLNGKSLLQQPLTERRQALYSTLKEKEGELQFAIAKTSTDVEELELFLSEAVDAATEGLIVKTLTDTYEPSKRSSHWLKLKKDYLEGVGDTFDVVPIGAFYGKGKRTGVFGAYLLAVYDPDNECYQTISKLGTGFSEEQLKELADSLKPHIIISPRKYYQWADTLEPDVWFDPIKVWEVKAADLSISPVHRAAAGLVDAAKGISIRFPRLIRVRDDKGPEDTTSPQQIAEMYQKQAVVTSKNKKKEEDE